jgi:hypothetical protein
VNGACSTEDALADQDVRCLAANPLHPGVVYAGTQGRGVLRYDDRGVTWRPCGLDGHIIKALAVWAAIEQHDARVTALAPVQVKGRQTPVQIFQLR